MKRKSYHYPKKFSTKQKLNLDFRHMNFIEQMRRNEIPNIWYAHNHTPYMAHKTIVREILKKEFDLITQCALPIQSYKPAEIN